MRRYIREVDYEHCEVDETCVLYVPNRIRDSPMSINMSYNGGARRSQSVGGPDLVAFSTGYHVIEGEHTKARKYKTTVSIKVDTS